MNNVEEIGWQVIDPAGNVIESGPLIEMKIVALSGEEGA